MYVTVKDLKILDGDSKEYIFYLDVFKNDHWERVLINPCINTVPGKLPSTYNKNNGLFITFKRVSNDRYEVKEVLKNLFDLEKLKNKAYNYYHSNFYEEYKECLKQMIKIIQTKDRSLICLKQSFQSAIDDIEFRGSEPPSLLSMYNSISTHPMLILETEEDEISLEILKQLIDAIDEYLYKADIAIRDLTESTMKIDSFIEEN